MSSRLLFLLMLLAPAGLVAQEAALSPATSQELWLSASLRTRAPKFMKDLLGDHYKKLRFGSSLGYRSADNFFAGRQLYLELHSRYRFNKHFNLGVEYRYANRGALRSDRQRFQLIGGASTSWERFDFSYRVIQQWVFLDEGGTSTFLRNRFGVEYNIRKWKLDPSFEVEFFTRTDDPQGWNHIGTRYRLGTEIGLGKAHSISPTLVYDSDTRVAWPVNRVIYSIGYSLDLWRL